MTETTRRFVLKLVRFQLAVEAAHARLDESFVFDRAFDAGEFSGPAYARMAAREETTAAARFGFANADAAFDAVALLRVGVGFFRFEGGPLPLPR